MKRPPAFWVICIFHAIAAVLLLVGQTSAIFAYDWAVSLGLQESLEEVTPFGIQMNRAIGTGDTVVYIPLIIASLAGLILRKRWALPVTAAAMGVSAYWTVTMASLMYFARSVPGYTLTPGIDYVIFVGSFFVFGVWGLLYIALRGDRLIA